YIRAPSRQFPYTLYDYFHCYHFPILPAFHQVYSIDFFNFSKSSSATFVGSFVLCSLSCISSAKSQRSSIRSLYLSQDPHSPSCSYQTCIPCFDETKITALALKGIDFPKSIPFFGSNFSTSILFALAISNRTFSMRLSILRRARETACLETPK